MKKICVIGGGLSGLTTAYLLKDKYKVTLYEANHRFGGYVQTFRKNGYIIDVGPNTILNNEPTTLELLEKLKLTSEIVNAKEESRIRYIYTDDKLHVFPSNPMDLFKSDLFPLASKFKIIKEMLIAPTYSEDQKDLTISNFLKLHFDSYIADTIARSAFVGIFGGDSKKLNVGRTLPKLVKMAEIHKSLLKALQNASKEKKPSTSMNLKNGLETLTEALAKEIEHKESNHEVLGIQRGSDKYKVKIKNHHNTFEKEFDHVVVTTHGMKTYSWLKELDPSISDVDFDDIKYAPLRVLALGFKKRLNFKGFGVLVDPDANKNILGFLHPTDIFDNRAPANKDTLIVMMGGTFKPDMVKMSMERSAELALADLKAMIGPLPELEFMQIVNHLPGIVQYDNDQLGKFRIIDDALAKLPNFYFNSLITGGISVNDSIRKAFEITEKIIRSDV